MTWALKQALATASAAVHAAGLCPGRSGNISVRTREGLLVTPTGASLGSLSAGDIVELEADGSPQGHRGKVRTSEWRLHCDVYAARADVGAIVHTHSRFATVFSCLRQPLRAVHYMIAVAGTSTIPVADYATYGTQELSVAALKALGTGKACLLANHGLVALGVDLDEAVRVALELENLAALEWHSRAIGSPVVLDEVEVRTVVEKFGSYGKKSP